MSDFSYSVELVDKALKETSRLSVVYVGFKPLDLIRSQLYYVKGVLDGSVVDSGKLNNVNLGLYAAREFEDRDMEFANLLYDVEDLVARLRSAKKRRV